MTAIQARERAPPSRPMKPGLIERREFEYKRHGTRTLIAAFDVASGKLTGDVGDSRKEDGFARVLDKRIPSAAAGTKWNIVLDNLNIHLSESLVRLIAKHLGIEQASLGQKGKHGILKPMQTA